MTQETGLEQLQGPGHHEGVVTVLRQGRARVTLMPDFTVSGEGVVTSEFGPNGQRVMALVACIAGLSAGQVDQVTRAWDQGSRQGEADVRAKSA